MAGRHASVDEMEYYPSAPLGVGLFACEEGRGVMDGSERSKDFDWRYDLEEEEFVYRIISMAGAVHLWDGTNLTYANLLRDNPHRAYVIAIEYRTLTIVDRFKSLDILERMLAYDGFPIKTVEGSIFRDQWIRIILDVLLSRLTSIRDCCFLFAAEIYELGIDARNVNLGSLKKHIRDKGVVDVLIKIADTARNIRDERDRHLHRGEERALSGELDQFFHLVARSEGRNTGHPKLGFLDPEKGAQPVEINLSEMHSKIISDIRTEYHQEGDGLIALTRELFVVAEPEFERRWAKKRDSAKLVRSWELPS